MDQGNGRTEGSVVIQGNGITIDHRFNGYRLKKSGIINQSFVRGANIRRRAEEKKCSLQLSRNRIEITHVGRLRVIFNRRV